MRERLIEFLKNENKSSAQLAEEIGVQASGISHIISGRNNPSLDFILKMLERYPFISTDWLLFGAGSMYKEQTMSNHETISSVKAGYVAVKAEGSQSELNFSTSNKEENVERDVPGMKIKLPEIIKIVWFYDDNRFEEFHPVK